MDRSSPNQLLGITISAITLFLLASCVSQKKYEQKSAALSRMDSLYFVCQENSRHLQQDVDALTTDTARYAREVQELIKRYNQIAESSSSEIKELQEENAALQEELTGYRITLSKYTIDWRALKEELMESDSVLSVFSYRLDTMLSRSGLPYQILRHPSELVVHLPEAHIFDNRNRLRAEADTTIGKLNQLIADYPSLRISSGISAHKQLDKLTRLTGHIVVDSSATPITHRIDPNLPEDAYGLFFTLRNKHGLMRKE